MKKISRRTKGQKKHTVGRDIDFRGQRGDLNLEALLDRVDELGVLAAGGDKGDGETLCSKTTGTTNTVKVLVSAIGEVIVDDNVDTLNVDATANQVSGNHDALLEVLESLVALDTIFPLFLSVTNESMTKYRSAWGMPEWMQIEGNESFSSTSVRALARWTDLTKMTTWQTNAQFEYRNINK